MKTGVQKIQGSYAATGVLEGIYGGSGHSTYMAKIGGLLVGVEGSSVRAGGTYSGTAAH